MRVLVVYASKRGATAGIALAIGDRLRAHGHDAVVAAADTVHRLDVYDAVVVGGALYAARWPRAAARFVREFSDELRQRPVWFFSSGPLEAVSGPHAREPTGQVGTLMRRVGARDHATFGGHLDANATGILTAALIRNGHAGDFRDWAQVDHWSDGIARELERMQLPAIDRIRPAQLRRMRNQLCLMSAVASGSALLRGIELMAWPKGSPWLQLPLDSLADTGFESFFWPGVLLACLVGLPNLIGAIALRRHAPRAHRLAAFGGAALALFTIAELLLLRNRSLLELSYLTLGFVIVAFGVYLSGRDARVNGSLATSARTSNTQTITGSERTAARVTRSDEDGQVRFRDQTVGRTRT